MVIYDLQFLKNYSKILLNLFIRTIRDIYNDLKSVIFRYFIYQEISQCSKNFYIAIAHKCFFFCIFKQNKNSSIDEKRKMKNGSNVVKRIINIWEKKNIVKNSALTSFPFFTTLLHVQHIFYSLSLHSFALQILSNFIHTYILKTKKKMMMKDFFNAQKKFTYGK